MTPISPLEQRLITASVVPYLSRVVRPVVIDTPGKPHFGSGQVFEVGDRHILVTAGHNLAEYGLRTREISYRVGVAPNNEIDLASVQWLIGERRQAWGRTCLVNVGDNEPTEIRIDIGLVELLPGEAEGLGLETLPLSAIEPGPLQTNAYLFVIGYPTFLYDLTQYDDGKVRARFGAFATGVPDHTAWPSYCIPDLHQVALWPSSGVERLDEGKIIPGTLPPADGISGCGMWTLFQHDDLFHPIRDLRFVGVEYGVEEAGGMIVGVNGTVVASQLAHFFPEARAYFEAVGFPLYDASFGELVDAPQPEAG